MILHIMILKMVGHFELWVGGDSPIFERYMGANFFFINVPFVKCIDKNEEDGHEFRKMAV